LPLVSRHCGAEVSLLDSAALATRFPWLNTASLSLGSMGERWEGFFDPWQLLQVRAASLCVTHLQAGRGGGGGHTAELTSDRRSKLARMALLHFSNSAWLSLPNFHTRCWALDPVLPRAAPGRSSARWRYTMRLFLFTTTLGSLRLMPATRGTDTRGARPWDTGYVCGAQGREEETSVGTKLGAYVSQHSTRPEHRRRNPKPNQG
jgi:hypothetical protein